MRERFDVFCSYAHADADPVRRLVDALEARGVGVYLDQEEIADFEGITRSIERGLARSKALLAFYSTTYPTRRPCQWELTAAFLAAQREGDLRRRVLVVNPESDAEHIHPVELRDALFADADDVSASADSVAAHVAGLDGVLGDVGSLVPPAWHPEQRTGSSRFVGRIEELWALHSALHASDVGLITGAVSSVAQVRGLGGMGKSLVAEEYALRFGAAYPGGVFWLRGYGHGDGSLDPVQREAERERQLETFAARVGLRVDGLHPAEVEGALGRWIADQPGLCLWVVDDLASDLGDELSRWLAPHPAAKTLITSRSREYDALGRHVDLAELPAGEAYDLLTKRRPPRDEGEHTAALAITAELGHHPLALDVAAAALRFQTFDAFFDALREPSEDWLEQLAAQLRDALPNGRERSIARTLSTSIEGLGQEGLDFLRLAAVLAAAPIPADLVTAVFASIDDLDERTATARQMHALDQVTASSLADDTGELAWRVHTLVTRTIRFTDPTPERREAFREAAISVMNTAFATNVDRRTSSRIEPSVPHARELSHRAADAAALTLLGWVARYDYERAHFASAQALFQALYDTRRSELGEDHADTLTALNDLAETLAARGDLDGARKRFERVLEGSRRVLGDTHPDTLTTLNNLAATLAEQRVDGARQMIEQAHELSRRVLGDRHPDTLMTLNNLAEATFIAGDIDRARAMHEQALKLRRHVLGVDHPSTLTSMNNLGVTYRRLDQLARAQRLLQRGLALSRSALGEEHPGTIRLMNSLALTLRDRGEFDTAHDLHQQALVLMRHVLGDEHPDTVQATANLAATLRACGDLASARALEETIQSRGDD